MDLWPASEVLALADDLTGALEVGAHFAESGIAATVWTAHPPQRPISATVIDTETRHLTPAEAAERVRDCARRFRAHYLLKKTDSTLRGHIRAELNALREVFPNRQLLYSPAAPQHGRVVREGQLLVHGRPVHETDFANDALNPVLTSDLRAYCEGGEIARTADELRRFIMLGVQAVICDGETTAEVSAYVREALLTGRPFLAAGPGAFARVWVDALPLHRQAPHRSARPVERALVVSGSRHRVSKEQVRTARDVPVCSSAAELRTAFGKSSWAALMAPEETASDAAQVAKRLAAAALELQDSVPLDAIIVFGGDTAAELLRALRVQSVRPIGELLPGVPLSSIDRSPPLLLVTKAGGFGEPTTLDQIRDRLKG